MYEAMFYRPDASGRVHCLLCCHRCIIRPGRSGVCGVRRNDNGRLVSMVYGKLVAEHVDPIEKKPLFHFLPGSLTYSISTVGCNFRCLHCQNFSISQYPADHPGKFPGRTRSPQQVTDAAIEAGCASISYTYVEPTVFYEFARDCAVLAKQADIRNVFVSNGYMTQETVRDIAPLLDAINIDVKCFDDKMYRKICHAHLKPVLENIALFCDLGVWVEVTTLIIPGINDSSEELKAIAGYIHSVSSDIPWHVTAFRPTYKMTDRPAARASILHRACKIGHDTGLTFVYPGNILEKRQETVCPTCGRCLVERNGFLLQNNRLEKRCCDRCGRDVAGIWT
ncbi:MAG: AmmeMemoRadiSam system radical SAM enzyme [Deltaproteobacteria bacterium]|nr:MAG: AmmeMemoRadiSam system radical SAM enzyme [Deltaproteobacteria bacterium]